MIISSFRGDNWFLSNFATYPFAYTNVDNYVVLFPTAEHAYQYAKAEYFADENIMEKIRFAKKPGDAKKLGRLVENFTDDLWNPSRKVSIMRKILNLKFRQNKDIHDKLLETSPYMLMEGNTWGDTFWGVDAKTLKGLNWLGILLMELRSTLATEHV